jgi:hypothetical protein
MLSNTTWIVLGVIAVVVIGAIMIYNGLVAMRQRVNNPLPISTFSFGSATTSFPTWSRR